MSRNRLSRLNGARIERELVPGPQAAGTAAETGSCTGYRGADFRMAEQGTAEVKARKGGQGLTRLKRGFLHVRGIAAKDRQDIPIVEQKTVSLIRLPEAEACSPSPISITCRSTTNRATCVPGINGATSPMTLHITHTLGTCGGSRESGAPHIHHSGVTGLRQHGPGITIQLGLGVAGFAQGVL